MALEPNRSFDPVPQFTMVFTPSSLRRPPDTKIHTIRNRPIPQPPGYQENKPYGYLGHYGAGVQVTVGRGNYPAPARLSLPEIVRRVAARFSGYPRGYGLTPTDPNDPGGPRAVKMGDLPPLPRLW
jgi:hypothetical protein